MSFMQDVRSFYQRIRRIWRSRVGARDETLQLGHGVDLSKEDSVVVYVANKSFDSIYPTSDSNRICNTRSIGTAIVSLTSNLSFCVFAVMATVFAGNAISGAFAVYGGGLTLWPFLTDFATNLAVTGSAYGLGCFTRSLDRDMTMNLCLESASKRLEDKQLKHQMALQIAMENIATEKEKEIAPHKFMLSDLRKQRDDLWHLIGELMSETGGDEADRLAKIADLRVKRNKIIDHCAVLDAQIEGIEKEFNRLAGNVRVDMKMVKALTAAETIEKLKTGALGEEIEKLRDGARSKIEAVAEDAKNRRDNLLIDIGLDDRNSVTGLLPEATSRETLLLTSTSEDDDRLIITEDDEEDE